MPLGQAQIGANRPAKQEIVAVNTQSNPVRWFEIPVSDMSRATRFYEQVFGHKLTPIDPNQDGYSCFPMQPDRVGTGGALRLAPEQISADRGVTIYFGVDAIDPVLERIQPAGGKVAMPRQSIGPYGFIAQILDTEGNRIALHEIPADGHPS